ncbi:electron transfer flavoprotein subunit beta [Thermoplasma sp. Kam2015]|uniref:electron transfer flavoprotein subunit beta/FixA family protein n=1 Tax=Thermoplasma sp. Kam2015 TaxID=2094122 RepID=UPI000D9556F7|nr:electron transfer flavoprotein subunit beta/FixA family protein [Thermoplasma sp. Kam2015]PYB69002.1 electron transfer flavoprotein subunit beta [Thermoplasma sp. Kam2015]
MVNVAVLIKQIIDIDQMKTDSEGKPILTGVPYRLENLSKNAIEAAVRIKEKHGGKVTGIIFGTEAGTSAMKESYAMGVDEGILITGYKGSNPQVTAKAILTYLKQIQVDMVILGDQSADSYTGMLPGLISAGLGIPLLGNANRIDIEGKVVRITQVGETENVEMEAEMPVVVSVTQEINEPRLPPVLQIMAAGRKPIRTEKFDGSFSNVSVLSNLAPKSERKKKVFEKVDEGVAEIVKVLKEEVR